MNIIITGATGFVGLNLVRKLHTNSNFNLYALIREKSDVSLIPDGIQIIQLSQIENLTYALQNLTVPSFPEVFTPPSVLPHRAGHGGDIWS